MHQPSSSLPRIFISIASFCDPMLLFTIRSALRAARHAERLSFGIVDQNTTSIAGGVPQGPWRIACLDIDPTQSRGACWARALAMTLYAGEDYFLQVDSHTLFEQDWDVTLIDTLETIAAGGANARIVVSSRPFAFEFMADGSIETRRFTRETIRLIAREPVLNLAQPVMSFAAWSSGEMVDLPGYQISAAFLFARGAFIDEVPYDPRLYFHGEEQNISIRAFSHGWDIWHPNAMPLYHLYKTRSEGEAPLHWDCAFEDGRQEKWSDLRDRAHRRLGDLIAGRLAGAYGLGKARSIDDYLAFSGLKIETNVVNG